MQKTFLKAICCLLTCEALLFFLQWTTSLSNPSRDTLVICRLHMQNIGNQEQLWMLDTGEQGIPQQQLSEFVCILNCGGKSFCVAAITWGSGQFKKLQPIDIYFSIKLWVFSKKKKFWFVFLLFQFCVCTASNKPFFLGSCFRLAKVQENTIASLRSAASHVCTHIFLHTAPV